MFAKFIHDAAGTMVLLTIAGCTHGPARTSPAAPPAAVTRVAAPGALPNEKDHVFEAQWAEVDVKARKSGQDGKEVVSAIKVVQPKIRILHAASKVDDSPDQKDSQSDETIDFAAVLRKITPLEVDHIDVLDGQIAFVDVSRKERPEIWMHNLQLSVENLTTRVHLTEGRPVLLTARATVARSGTLSIFITVDPFETGLTFSGRATLVGLETAELYRFVETASNLHAPEGTIDMFMDFDCRNGELTGGVKPVLKNVKIRPDDKGVITVVKSWVADLAVKLFSDRVSDRNAVATVIPIKGSLVGPDVQVWPAIFGVMRNAFVEGLTSGYAHLPPATAPTKEGVVTQGVKAITDSTPPKAQPSP